MIVPPLVTVPLTVYPFRIRVAPALMVRLLTVTSDCRITVPPVIWTWSKLSVPVFGSSAAAPDVSCQTMVEPVAPVNTRSGFWAALVWKLLTIKPLAGSLEPVIWSVALGLSRSRLPEPV